MSIFNSLGSNYPTYTAAVRIFFAQGSATDHQHLQQFLDQKYQGKTALVYKGREAISLALKLAELPADSYVAVNGFTCYAVYEAIANQGLKVEYLDIGDNNLDFSAATLADALQKNSKIRAVMIQNTLGIAAEVPAIAQICKEKNILLIEDLAHSLGTTYADGRQAGTVGDFTILSFSQDKVVDAVSGGALIVRNQAFLNRLKEIKFKSVPSLTQLKERFYPPLTWRVRTFYDIYIGKVFHRILRLLNALANPMSDLGSGFHSLPNWQCRVVLDQLKNLENNLMHRRQIAEIYSSNVPKSLQFAAASSTNTILRFPIKTSNRSSLISFLKHRNFHLSDIWYDAPIGPKKYLAKTSYTNVSCPKSESMSQQIVNLPTHASISIQQAEQLSTAVSLWHNSPSNQ